VDRISNLVKNLCHDAGSQVSILFAACQGNNPDSAGTNPFGC
jgi:hypothetical protein